MCRTGMCRFGIGNWIFLIATLHLFTYAKGGDELKPDSGVRFTVEPSDVVAAAGESALLACAAAAKHTPRLSWRFSAAGAPTRDHAVSNNDAHRRQLSNGSLVVEKVSAALAGQYQCVASVDGVGTIVSRVATLFLAELPTIAAGARTISGTLGGAVLVPCAVQAPPRLALRMLPAAAPDRRVYGAQRLHHQPPVLLLNVTWLRGGVPLRPELGRVSVSSSGALEIDPLRHHDAAAYACRVSLARAPHQHVTSEPVEVVVGPEPSVEYPPRFVATPHSLTVMEGSSVTFDCAAVGNPKPEMTWLNNGVEIDLSDLDSRFYRWGCGSLRVQSARALDAGAYTCRAHSRLDSADHTAQLHVQTFPRVQLPGGTVAVTRARGDVTLACAVRGRPSPAVAWLKDGEPITLSRHDIALVDGSSLRIQGVLFVDAGMFQCVATSPVGSAQASLRLVVLPPDDDIDPPNVTVANTPFTNSYFNTMTSSTYAKSSRANSSHTQDIFNSLISSGNFGDQMGDPTPDDLDFLGETSSAFTSGPELEYDYSYDSDSNDDDDLHADEGLDLEHLRRVNSSVISKPKGLRAVIVKHRFVTLSWEEPESKNEDISGYAVIYRVKGSERERVSRGGARHEMNVAALQPNTTYQFQVLAYTQHAFSPPTDPLEVTTPEEELSHGAPASLRVEATAPHTLRASWSPPPAHAHVAPPDKYQIVYTELEAGREQSMWVEVDPASAALNATVTGLRAAAQYSVRVAAAAGASSDEVRVRMPSDVPAAPPANVSAVPTGATSILVRWEAPPLRSQHGALTGYKVRYRALAAGAGGAGGAGAAGGERRKADSLTTPADARRADLRALDAGSTYQIRVCAINANGSGPFSEWVTATTVRRQQDETTVPPQPPPLTTRAGRDWISVWWAEQDAGVVVRGWWLGWGRGVPDEHARELPARLHSHAIHKLEPNSEYVISLRGMNALGMGPAVYATVRTRGAPGDGDAGDDDDPEEDDEEEEEQTDVADLLPPVGLKVIMLSGTTAVVYWTDPTLPKGQTATDGRRYVVRWAAAGGARARTYNASDLNCMLDDLRPNTHYEFAVKLIKGGRESQWSMIVSNTTLEAAPSSPPRELRVTPAAPPSRAADLSWAPPARPNGAITGYVIMYLAQRGGSEEWSAVAVAGDRLRARVERLRPRTAYQFKVQARNAKGLGPPTPAVPYTTAMESGEGGGLASATSAWLWASAGGACAVLALAAALALSLCCRRARPPLSPDTSTYQKSSASAGIKPPDLWIHHDQMELKHMDKSLHSSAISAGSVDGANALMSSTLTLPRAADYEPPRPNPPPALDRHLVPTYVEGGRPWSRGGSSDDACASCASGASASARVLANMHANTLARTLDDDYTSMTGMGVGVGVGCVGTCERRAHGRHPMPDQSTPLLAGVGPLGSPQTAMTHPHHHPPCAGGGGCPLGAACAGAGGSEVYACAARERGHYVAYEPLGHYTHRDSLSSEAGALPPLPGAGLAGTLPGAGGAAGAGGAGGGAGGSLQRHARAMHSFLDNASDHSTPAHSRAGSARETSPYKKSASSSPGHIPNRLQLGGAVPHCSSELEPLTPSRSTERLQREMQNLEGLMKDLSAITQHQFHC